MGLRDSLEQVKRTDSKKCRLGKILDSLEGEDRKALQEALDSSIGYRRIKNALSANNITVGTDPIVYHRNKTCVCFLGESK